eukprot:m.132651 g.132651  ORF g.132651 m.132651 type:complete len:169 (+) comp11338_c1_seq6:3-509(+)
MRIGAACPRNCPVNRPHGVCLQSTLHVTCLNRYVDDPDLLGVITAQHMHPLLTRRGKVCAPLSALLFSWSIPLGTRHPNLMWPVINSPPPLDDGGHKPRTLLMSLSDWEFRKMISRAITGNSDGELAKDATTWEGEAFFQQMHLSKYVHSALRACVCLVEPYIVALVA